MTKVNSNTSKTNETTKKGRKSKAEVKQEVSVFIHAGRDLFGNSTARLRSHFINLAVMNLCKDGRGVSCKEIENELRVIAEAHEQYDATGADDSKAISEKTIASVRAHLMFIMKKQFILLKDRLYYLNAETLVKAQEAMKEQLSKAPPAKTNEAPKQS